MNNLMIFGILLQPNLESLIPTLPALGIMVLLTLALVAYSFSKSETSPLAVFQNLNLGAKVALVAGAQILLLVGFAAKYQLVLAHAQPILLRTAISDPFDPFRGNFMAFTYDISELKSPNVAFKNVAPLYDAEVIWVKLRPSDPAWLPVSVSDHPTPCSHGEVNLKGVVQNHGNGYVCVHYGLEQYFYPANKHFGNTRRSLATVAVNPEGEAVLTNLLPIPN